MLRVAIPVVSGLLAVPLLAWAAGAGGDGSGREALAGVAGAGLAVVLLYGLGGLFALGRPRVAAGLFLLAGLVGVLAGRGAEVDGLVGYGLLALALAATSLVSARHTPPDGTRGGAADRA